MLGTLYWPLITVGIFVVALLVFGWWYWHWTSPEQLMARRIREGRCPMCGYPRARRTTGVCPNCGLRDADS
jgi:hypothetical protein